MKIKKKAKFISEIKENDDSNNIVIEKIKPLKNINININDIDLLDDLLLSNKPMVMQQVINKIKYISNESEKDFDLDLNIDLYLDIDLISFENINESESENSTNIYDLYDIFYKDENIDNKKNIFPKI